MKSGVSFLFARAWKLPLLLASVLWVSASGCDKKGGSGPCAPTQLAGGGSHALALCRDGTVWAWGLNSHGQLGDGTATDRATPVQVPGLTGVAAVAAGAAHSLALSSEGTVWSWGYNRSGQLGQGDGEGGPLPQKNPASLNLGGGALACVERSSHGAVRRMTGHTEAGAKLRPFLVPQAGEEEVRAGKEAAARTERMKQRTPRVDFCRVAEEDVRLRRVGLTGGSS